MEITTKPDWGGLIARDDIITPLYQAFFDDIELKLNANLLGPVVQLTGYTVATVPTVISGGMIYVSDETGGAVPAFSDGTNWRRVTDRAIVS